MSYEGYVQQLCTNGHYSQADAYADGFACVDCGAEIAWTNAVDETNCDSFGYIPPEEFKKILVKEETVEVCNLGHAHITSPAVYRIPAKDELQRYHRDYRTNNLEKL